MDEPELVVKYLVACERIEIRGAGRSSPYTLVNVGYEFEVPGDKEWPVRFAAFWLYARFYYGRGTRWLGLSVVWLDPPDGDEQEVAYYELQTVFPADTEVYSRCWDLSAVRFLGPGRYSLRLTDEESSFLGEESILVRRVE